MPAIDKTIVQMTKTLNGFNKSTMEKVRLVLASARCCVAEFKVVDDHVDHLGALHGGFSAAIIDNISSLALITDLKSTTTTVCLNLNYLKPAFIGEEVIVDSRVVKIGKKIALINVEMRNKLTGDLIVTAAHTKIVLK